MTGPAGPVRPDGGTASSPLFDRLPDPAVRYTLDREPAVSAVNPAFEAAFDVDEAAVVGQPLAAVLPAESADQSAPAAGPADLLDAVRDGEAASAELRHETGDGARHFLVRAVPAVDHGTPRGYVVYTDRTEQRRTIRDLETRAERLRESAHTIAHDLRNPLEVAEINLEVARETGDDDLLEEVAEAHDQMERLIEDVLALADSGQVIGKREPVALEAVFERAWSNVDTRDASLEVDVQVEVEADADRLQQLLENLLRNAVEHGGSGVSMHVGALGEGGFYVEDDGPGIPEEARDRVFEQGYSQGDGGTGLGLTIVERIAEAHGWDVSVTAGREGGARFEVRVDGGGVSG